MEENFNSTIILVTNEGMGNGERELSLRLISIYLTLLLQNNLLPKAKCFYTEGVKLVVEGSPLLDILDALGKKSVRLIICGTCLNNYHLSEKVKVGIIGGMGDILEAQSNASKVISI